MWCRIVVKRIFFLFTENSEDKDKWKQKAWEDLVLKVSKTSSQINVSLKQAVDRQMLLQGGETNI